MDTKKTPPSIEVCPENLGAMLEYWYIERGLFVIVKKKKKKKIDVSFSFVRPVIDNEFRHNIVKVMFSCTQLSPSESTANLTML